ncbi:hypothetical protein BK789_25505 [Bacillus thuringiensis serovar darmstadiensis]|nr:hypothetical protein BK789_25505 [Bacillus thuringiensis serovar darmstadiensis]
MLFLLRRVILLRVLLFLLRRVILLRVLLFLLRRVILLVIFTFSMFHTSSLFFVIVIWIVRLLLPVIGFFCLCCI